MEKLTLEAIERQYKDYFFLGKENTSEGNIIGLEMSNKPTEVRTIFKDLMMVDKESKWWLLNTILKAFEYCDDNEYEEFRKHIKLCKRNRYVNHKNGKIPITNTVKEIV